ncbi:O-antigen ligase [Streptomyces sp. TS71-3]|uniref:O-antigen ligase family protein n=1 Tax=Streptomyces sp. TS71-3 TaxID=2733862 RepID=UPI001B284A2A|nr:O-antigen ligase family protein [Streptomyces sp. TS71-3]GHJ39987.1 hypothetical protein Sm713_55960 [Streptomyces sp. TS71-3]
MPARVRLAFGRWGPVLPVVALVAALGLPALPSGEHALPGPGSSGALGASGGQGGTVADALSGLVVLCAAVRAVRLARRPLTRTAAVVLGLPVVGFAVAATGAPDIAGGLAGLARYLQVFVLVPAAVLLLIRDRAQLRLVAWAFVALALWEGGLGVVQYATGTGASYMGSDVRAVGTFGPGDVMGMATTVAYGMVCAVGMALGVGEGARVRARGAAGAGRSPWGRQVSRKHLADSAHRTDSGHQAGSAHPAGSGRQASWGRQVHSERKSSWGRERVAALVCAVLLVVPLAVSFSRGAWIATVVACAAQLLLTGLRRFIVVAAALAASLAVLVGGVGVGSSMLEQRLTSISHVADAPDQSVVDRYTMWSAALGMWREHPLTGVGMKGFPAYRDSHASLALSSGSDTEGAGAAFRRQPLLSPHNMYLLVLGEQGLLGIVGLGGSWAALLVCGVSRTVVARRRASRPSRLAWTPLRGRTGAGRPAVGAPAVGAPAGERGARPASAAGSALDCGLVACGLLIWQLMDFAYADIGGPSTVLTAVVLGVAAWWGVGARALGAAGAERNSRTSGAGGQGGVRPASPASGKAARAGAGR